MRLWLLLSLTLALAGLVGAQPAITTSGILNASGYQNTLAPDTVFVIFGSGLGPAAIATAAAPNYPSSLSGTSITFTPSTGGTAVTAKMVYTLASQVAGLLPSSIAPGTYAVRVTYNSQISAAQNVTVVPRSFGIAAANSGGTGTAQATIGNVNGGISLTRFNNGAVGFNGLNWTLTPAHPGDALVLWGTGGGADTMNDAGGSSGDQTVAGNFIVIVGTRKITPLYAGTSSGYPGLWQINFALPADIPLDCFAAVQVSAGGVVGNTVTVPIAAAGQSSCSDASMSPAILSKLDSGGPITFGAFAIAKITETTAGITQETGSGEVLQYTPTEWIILNSGPRFGLCRVYDRTYPAGGKDPGSPDTLLDAGTKLPLTGPNLPAGFGLSTISTATGPVYGASLAAGTLANGSYTLNGPGGTQVGPFTATTTFPLSFNVTNWNNITAIDRTQPLVLNWSGSGFDQVAVVISSTVATGNLRHLTTINCTLPATPSTYTIDSQAMALLSPVAATGTNFGSISVQGITRGVFTANLIPSGQLDFGALGANLGLAKNIAMQ
ncbi:MAG TPA: hypothetical protein VGN17_21180 [Bryobacteraceae bacterium]|jgi:uncharacterized protein (TIGR03437 family)